MLAKGTDKLISRRIYLDTANLAFQKVLHSLLAEWGYQVLEKPEAGGVALIQEGRPIPLDAGRIIRLGASRYLAPDRISIPVSLEELWRQLESRFYRIPRNHIRRAVSLPASVMVRGDRVPAEVVSLSDWGCRFSTQRGLKPGEPIELEMNIAKVSISLRGRVIYCISRSRETGGDRTETGIVFEKIPAELRTFLRRNLILGYLARVREQLTTDEFRAGVAFLNLSPRILESLGCHVYSRRNFPPGKD